MFTDQNILVCYSIGHSNYACDDFIGLLKKYNMDCLVDVRSAPYSKYVPQFNKEQITAALKNQKILYVYMGNILGGRYTDKQLLFDDGTVNFSAVSYTESFQDGLEKLIKNIKKGLKIALMCAEKNPFDCHRFALISRFLSKRGVVLKHILEDGAMIANEELEEKLLKKYKKEYNFGQAALFETPQSREEALEEAYVMLNRDIAFKSEQIINHGASYH